MTDWALVKQSLVFIKWVMFSDEKDNENKSIYELWKEKFNDGERKIKLLNVGFLMMTSYIMFEYLNETELKTIDYRKIDSSSFKIIHSSKALDSEKITKSSKRFVLGDTANFEQLSIDQAKRTTKKRGC